MSTALKVNEEVEPYSCSSLCESGKLYTNICTVAGRYVPHVENIHRRFLISSFGLFAARLWARHIHDRFRDAVSAQAPSYALQLPDPDREVIRTFHLGTSRPRRARYCRAA